MTLQNPALSRRTFVKSSVAASGGLMLALSLPKANAGLDPRTGEPTGTEISAWLTIDPNSQVTIRVAQSEMGEGVFTAMPMLVAEELDCDWNQVKAEYASANRSVRENGVYKRMGTGGSGAVRRSREYLQQAGASARERLKAAAAARWEVPVAELRTEGGEVFHDASGRRTAYGVLAAEAAAIRLAEEPPIRKAGEFKLLGTPLNRLDVPSKVDGSATFGIDVKVPGMVYAAYDACPVWGGTLAALDDAPALAVKGV
ncbi:MAG: molybdopterin cofactor-binding domain-containing protein, partial [Pseudomonadales bacterium]